MLPYFEILQMTELADVSSPADSDILMMCHYIFTLKASVGIVWPISKVPLTVVKSCLYMFYISGKRALCSAYFTDIINHAVVRLSPDVKIVARNLGIIFEGNLSLSNSSGLSFAFLCRISQILANTLLLCQLVPQPFILIQFAYLNLVNFYLYGPKSKIPVCLGDLYNLYTFCP